MSRDHVEDALDLRKADLDPEFFAAALAVRHIRILIAHGGSDSGRPDDETALHPHHLEAFLSRAVSEAQKSKRFEHDWRRLQQAFPHVKTAWEQGQILFRQDIARATSNSEEMEYLSMIDFAVDCYTYVTARNAYPYNRALEEWAVNGYMLAWRQHFFTEEDTYE